MQTEDARYPSLAGRTVFVTGGATGIGASIVEHFSAQGAKVGFVDIAGAEGEALVASIAARGHLAPVFRRCDLTDIPQLQATLAELAATLGPATVLVNNAASDDRHGWADVTADYWDQRMAVNLRHQFFAAQAVQPGMVAAGGGSIINFGSISWHLKMGGMPVYVTAKAAIEGLTAGLARDFGPDKIRVNCVIPGWVMTERQIKLWLTPEGEAAMLAAQCLKERLLPADLARMTLWLAADDSRMVTGQNFTVNAGWG